MIVYLKFIHQTLLEFFESEKSLRWRELANFFHLAIETTAFFFILTLPLVLLAQPFGTFSTLLLDFTAGFTFPT